MGVFLKGVCKNSGPACSSKGEKQRFRKQKRELFWKVIGSWDQGNLARNIVCAGKYFKNYDAKRIHEISLASMIKKNPKIFSKHIKARG